VLERESWIEKEMENLRLNREIKSYVKYWSKMRSEEIEMIFKIPWGIDRKRLKYDGVRNVVKKIIWKLG
jgi:hypothetical protein